MRSARARAGRWYARGKVHVMDRDEVVQEVEEAGLATTAPRRVSAYVCTVRVLV